MCGIAGFIGQGDEAILRRMTDSLKRRGPDDQGFFAKDGAGHGPEPYSVGLGHRRLSIIDVSGGGQPIYNEDKTIVVVFNGEIYNFQKLREELSSLGHKFYTKTDTEILVHLYEESGEDFLKKLNGMFALALWDDKRGKLILARDRLGEKPLHYAVFGQTIIFGSEIKAILEHPLAGREIDFFALAKYLTYEYVPAPQTIFKNIYKLEPGEYAVYENNLLTKNKYWEVDFSSKFKVKSSKLAEREIIESLETELERAVKERLVADVPLGVWLSGGLDSTSIAYFAQKNSFRPIKTFSIGFSEPSFDESKYARQAASFLGTEHQEKIIEARDCLELIPQITDFLDEPMADGSIVPTFLLAKFTRETVKVTLGGDGGDELFMGYPTFQAHQLAKFYGKLPLFLRNKIIAPLVGSLPASLNNISFDFKLKRFISGFEYPAEIRNQIWLGSFRPDDFKNIFTPEVYRGLRPQDIFEDIVKHSAALAGEPLENRLIYLYLKHYLQDDILVKTDRASMAVGLETRAPFLDHRLVELVNSLPASMKLKGWTTKYVFKKMMTDKLPKDIVERPKKGFGMPIGRWLKKELRDFALQLFAPEKIAKEGIFNPVFITQLLNEHLSGKKDNRKPLWTLMVFEMWLEKWA